MVRQSLEMLTGGRIVKESKKQPLGRRLGWLKNGNPPCDLSGLPRCNATSKSTGQRCRQPAMKNGKCHWHGGKSTGAPRGNQNALKHGDYTAKAKSERKYISDLIKVSKQTIEKT